MSRTVPLSYKDISRPSRDSATLQRTAHRASAAPQHRSAQPQPSLSLSHTATSTNGAAAPASLNGSVNGADPLSAGVAVSAAPVSSLDTWTGYLSAQWAETVKAASPAPSEAALRQSNGGSSSGNNLTSSLQTVVARQNRVVAQLQEKLIAQRTREEKEWEKKKKALESRESSTDHSGAAREASREAVENTQVCALLSTVLEHARLTWAEAVTEHFKNAEARKPSFTKRGNAESNTNSLKQGNGAAASPTTASPRPTAVTSPKAAAFAAAAAAAEITAESTMDEDRVGLPSVELLFRCLVDGVNAAETQQAITASGLLPPSAWASGVLGVDSSGILTVFDRHVQALRSFPGLVPSLEVLRACFVELHPSNLTSSHPCGPLDSTLEMAEAQLDTFLRVGEETEAVASLLREGLHPSVRRLVYARALQVPLAVTDGKPMFLPSPGFMTNHYSHGVSRYLTCASRHARDKIKRRFQHHYSSPKQEGRARLLQRLVLDDMFTAVGDSDKYFVYTDDIEVVATALVVDRSVPDLKLTHTLQQLGRPSGALDSYLAFLRFPEHNMITQKAPACGFFPVEGVTFLLAPVCNVTGDTVEQYELMSALMAQLWGRLQGPTPELLQCCLLFEALVQRLALPAVLHATRDLQYPPLVLAMRWMLTGFADLLDSFEVLSFWDLVLSYHMREMHRRSSLSAPVGVAGAGLADNTTPCALWLLPMYAAAIFVLRAPMVEACRTAAEVDVVFATGHQLRTRSLLQGLLFG